MNVRSLIQPSKTLSVELIGTYNEWWLLYVKKDKQLRKMLCKIYSLLGILKIENVKIGKVKDKNFSTN